MHRRKALMSSLSDGFLTLPGGYGTLEEFFETLTWAQLGLHTKPCALLDVAGFWDDLLAMVDTQIGEGFARDEHRQLILSGEDPEELLDRMAAYIPPGSIDPVPGLPFDGPPVHRDLEPEPALDGNRSAKRARTATPFVPARAAPPTRVIPRARGISCFPHRGAESTNFFLRALRAT